MSLAPLTKALASRKKSITKAHTMSQLLINDYLKQLDLIRKATRSNIAVDGALLYDLRMP